MMLRINVQGWLKVHQDQSTRVLKNLVLIENHRVHLAYISAKRKFRIVKKAKELYLVHTFLMVSLTDPVSISQRELSSLIFARISPVVSAVG
jgi:hypothetical protein